MDGIFEKYAKVKELYPDDIERIEEEESSVSQLLEQQDYVSHPGTQRLIAMCRGEIKTARLKLASDRALTPDAHRELWSLIDAREWFLRLVSKDYAGELARLEGELDVELEKGL